MVRPEVIECDLHGTPSESCQHYGFQFQRVKDYIYADNEEDEEANDVKKWFPCDHHFVFHRGCEPSLTYSELHDQVESSPTWQNGSVVAILLRTDQMAEMAVVLVSLLASRNVCAAPLDSNMPRLKLLDALKQLKCTGLVSTSDLLIDYGIYGMLADAATNFDERDPSLQDLRSVFVISRCHTKGVGAVDWTPLREVSSDVVSEPMSSNFPALLLRTSGTTAQPKVVPITRAALQYNATCLAASLRLGREDIGCNAMPLFHIGGISCALFAVLVSGGSVVMQGAFDPNSFLDCLLLEPSHTKKSKAKSEIGVSTSAPLPTWYYGVPTMHKSILVCGRGRLHQLQEGSSNMDFLPTHLRFIRSGGDHLPHQLALELSRLFHVPVMPTYSMSESMPVCSSTIGEAIVWNKTSSNINSVGYPIGCSLKVVDSADETLGYDQGVGEVAIRGPGVIQAYRDVSPSLTHTSGGWLKTGDMGVLDTEGRLVLKGRLKSVIKRGGDQVWPDEVDDVVKEVSGVILALTFGIPNELWGEEVAVAVVLTDEGRQRGEQKMKKDILEVCKEHLSPPSVPYQIVFLDSGDRLPKNPTGKYVRSGLADHLGITAKDTIAQSAMNAVVAATSTLQRTAKKAEPSTALNGLRLLVACFVVQGHIGLYPNTAWIRIQNFSMNMQVFFFLGAFQLVCSVGEGVLESWAQFVGTKIGSMHAFFFVSQLIALPSYLMFQCGANGWQEKFSGMSCYEVGKWWRTLIGWFINTACGIFDNEVNSASWFLAVFYLLIFLFPFIDSRLRTASLRSQFLVLSATMAISVFAFDFLYMKAGLWILSFKIIAWLPSFVTAMVAGYFFMKSGSVWGNEEREENCLDQRTFIRSCMWKLTRPGVVTDTLSAVCLMMEVTMAVGKDCAWVPLNQFEEMRPGEEIPDETFLEIHTGWNVTYAKTCNITMEEYKEHIFLQKDSDVMGRWSTNLSTFGGFVMLHFPLVWMWLYAMAHGQGLTVYLLNNRFLQKLGYLAYPLFLLHMPISRFYWVATRGHDAKRWWHVHETSPIPGDWYYEEYIEMPVAWYETLVIILICLVLGAAIDRYIIPHLMPKTMRLGVRVCKRLSAWGNKFCPCSSRLGGQNNESPLPFSVSKSVAHQVESMIRGITGQEVTRDTSLRGIGLDSLGATALLSILKASVKEASQLTMQDLARFQTAGDLIDALEAANDENEEVPDELENV